MQTVVGRIMARIRVLIPSTRECVGLLIRGLKRFVGVITLRILRRGDHPALFGWTQCEHRGSTKESGEGKRES